MTKPQSEPEPSEAADLTPSALVRRGKSRRLARLDLPEAVRTELGQSSPSAGGQAGNWRLWHEWPLWQKLLGWVALAALLGFLALTLVLEYFSRDLPSVAALKSGYDPPQVTRILAADDTVLASVFTERRTVVPFETIPDGAKLAFLAAEDAYFYEHEGLNYLGMLRALMVNLKAGRTMQGGSTITQQVVKNLLLGPARSYERKIKETLLARRLEQQLTKDEIFWLYCNHIYLGHGRYGIEEAARYYFGKHAAELRVDEAALLAGLVAAPERFSPRHDPEKALARRHYVLQQMLEKGFVTQALYGEMDRAPLFLAPATEVESELAPEALAESTQLLKGLAGDRKQGGFTVKTTIEPELQSVARRALRKGLDAYAERHRLLPPFKKPGKSPTGKSPDSAPQAQRIFVGTVEATDDTTGTILVRHGPMVGRVSLAQEARYNPEKLAPSQFAEVGSLLRVRLIEEPTPERVPSLRLELGPQGALVAIDVRTRHIVAMVGSYEALPGGFNRAVRAQRQPGSAFKPIVYSHALRGRSFTPVSLLPSGRPDDARPSQISLRQALAQSDNRASVYLFEQSGPRDVVDWAHNLGLSSTLQPDDSLALGAYEVRVLELCNVYATFAAGGMYEPPQLFQSVTGPDGRHRELPERGHKRRVLEPDEAYLITSLLRSVVETGTGQGAKRVGRPVAGKTGTTNDAKDAWFVGFSTDLAVAVWVGFDDSTPLGKRESGSKTALPIWADFMRDAHQSRPVTDFARPAHVLTAHIDPQTGLLPYPGQTDTVVEEFLPGTIPSSVAPDPHLAAPASEPAPTDVAAMPGLVDNQD